MFESTLKAKLQKIFELKKVSFDMPGESQEQECLFIQVERSKNTFKDARQLAKVQGKCAVFANAEKLPFGYISKQIASHPDDTKDLFFFDIEENVRHFENIVQRGFSFVYFFDSQYDPDIGTITTITTEVETT